MAHDRPTAAGPKEIIDFRIMRAIFAGLAILVCVVALHQYTGGSEARALPGRVLDERVIRMVSHRNGDTLISNERGEVIAEFGPADGRLLSALGPVIRRERMRHRIDADEPIIVRLRDGRNVSIYDPSTGHEFNLESYGDDNVAHLIAVLMP